MGALVLVGALAIAIATLPSSNILTSICILVGALASRLVSPHIILLSHLYWRTLRCPILYSITVKVKDLHI